MGTQRPVMIGEEPIKDFGQPIAEHHGKQKEKVKGKKAKVEEKIKAEKFKKEETPKAVEVERKEGESKEKEKTGKAQLIEGEKLKKTKVGKKKIRSKKYGQALTLVDRKKIYELSSAIELIKKTSFSRFDGNVEVHLRLLSKTGKPENVSGTLKYPHNISKKIIVSILDEKKIAGIQNSKKIDFDIALATPAMMSKVAKLAKILGPKGKMPNPKSGTVTNVPEKIKKELEDGFSQYKTDSYGIIHQIIGKVSTDQKVLEENFRALQSVVPREKIASVYLCATMGPAVKVAIK